MTKDARVEFRRHAARLLAHWESTYLSIWELSGHYDRSFPESRSYGVDIDEIAVSLLRAMDALGTLDLELRTVADQIVKRV